MFGETPKQLNHQAVNNEYCQSCDDRRQFRTLSRALLKAVGPQSRSSSEITFMAAVHLHGFFLIYRVWDHFPASALPAIAK